MADKIPDEIIREARRCYDKLGTGSIADSEHIARALIARDQRAAEIAQTCALAVPLTPGTADGASMAGKQIATAILTYDGGRDEQR